MKSSSNYGSDNEESNFIRRVAAPDRPSSKRRHKKRLALAGAATILIGATAGVGYVTLQSSQFATIATPVKQQMSANLVVPDFVESMGDPYYPTFDELDEDGDGVVAYSEYMKDLNEVWAMDKENIASSDLPQIVKDDLYDQLNDKITSDSACVKKAMIPTKKRTLTFDRKTIDSLYYMLEVYCFDTPIEVPEKYNKMFPDTQAPVPPPAPVIPEVPAPPSAATSAPIVIPSSGGEQTVTLVGPPVDGVQKIEIDTSGSGKVTTTVDVKETISGGEKLDIPDPGGKTTTITVPENEVPTDNGESEKKVEIETMQGPATVTINGSAINGKQDVTITDANGGTTTTTVDVTQTTDGKTKLEIPTGTDGQTTIVTVPQTSTAGSSNNAYSSGSQTNAQTQKPPTVEVDTVAGIWTVIFDTPVTDGTVNVRIDRHDGNLPTPKTLKVSVWPDGRKMVNLPTGPGDQTTAMEVPEWPEGLPWAGLTGGTSTRTDTWISTASSNNNAYSSGSQTTNAYSSGSQTNNAYSSGSQTNAQTQKARKVDIDTSFGRVTVVFNGPVTAERTQSVTILKNDGSDPQTLTLDVLQYATDNSLWVQIPLGPGENPRRVRIPDADGTSSTGTGTGTSTAGSNNNAYSSGSQINNAYSSGSQTNTQNQKPPSVEVDAATGFWTVIFVSPVTDGTVNVLIDRHDGNVPTPKTLKVSVWTDGRKMVKLETGPDGQTMTIEVPEWPEGLAWAGPNGGLPSPSVIVDTPHGPVTVTTDGPVIDGKQQVTITTPDGGTTTTTVEVTPTSDGKNALEIPTGPEGQSTIVTVPQNPSEGGAGSSQTNPNDAATKILVDTNLGPATVTIDGPAIDGKQDVVIMTPNGGTTKTTVDVTQTTDGKTELEIPTGPGGTTTTVSVPTTSTEGGGGVSTTDILNQLGGNDIDNGDKDFMSKDEFQLQIGTHFSEKIMSLNKQTRDEEAESDKLLNQQKKLQDCILQASNKFGYYGVYEQPPYFQNAVDWVDNDCLKQ